MNVRPLHPEDTERVLAAGTPGCRRCACRERFLMPNAELRVLEEIGHFRWLERPGIIYDEVVDFVASRSS
jgi:pimeloyl-ACP methyl ester carboxylesterase